MMAHLVLIPHDDRGPLQEIRLDCKDESDLECLISQNIIETDDLRRSVLLRHTDHDPGLLAYHAGTKFPNVRATRLAMACGLLKMRLFGNVLLFRRGSHLKVDQVFTAACVTPDLRESIASELDPQHLYNVPLWLADAAMHNYHDAEVLNRLAQVMTGNGSAEEEGSSSDADEYEDDQEKDDIATSAKAEFIARTPLCLHCRRPASNLCSGCHGAYFCDRPRPCQEDCWSHACFCSTWALYTKHREQISSFALLGDWYHTLHQRDFQLSEQPYEDFLAASLQIHKHTCRSWWRTEMDGWSGGQSQSAITVDVATRRSYEQGFEPIVDIPEECPLPGSVIVADEARYNELGWRRLESWHEYYHLRKIPVDSPVALLLTFPMTLYHSLVEFGQVPCTVSRLLGRPLRIHIVGAEKELNFIDLFKEVVYLLPNEGFALELVFVVREDMLPPLTRQTGRYDVENLTSNLTVKVVGGTYGKSLDPNFDCGSGPPDMIVAFNAGIYAYESWRSVVQYLDRNRGVVGVFTDYNEMSAVQCASLGGAVSRESVRLNPFRQPRAMTVYSMNLPQASNAFIYVFNQQSLE